MAKDIAAEIRELTLHADSLAPPVEDLIPPGMAAHFDVEPAARVTVRLPLAPPPRRQRIPGWLVGVAAAAVVLLIAVPTMLFVADEDRAGTTAPEVIDRGLGITPEQNLIEGLGWIPGSAIAITVNRTGLPEATADADGYFLVDVGSFGLTLAPDDVISATDGEVRHEIRLPELSFDRLDASAGVGTGTSSAEDGDTVLVDIQIGPAAGEADRFQAIDATVTDGRWSASFDPPRPGEAIHYAVVIATVPGATITAGADLR